MNLRDESLKRLNLLKKFKFSRQKKEEIKKILLAMTQENGNPGNPGNESDQKKMILVDDVVKK
ncbi:hypothetical protein C4569_00045 [Candidatus Parcubacteria bacterium]|nr:MAG: hypothetical protein C4569_00045 [Candidatus Parcubacteria bacterium]